MENRHHKLKPNVVYSRVKVRLYSFGYTGDAGCHLSHPKPVKN